MATAPSPNDLTRQQLDELDALLQRMLSVPLAPPDTPLPASLAAAPRADRAAEPPLPPIWRVDPPTPAGGAALPHLAPPDPLPTVLKLEPTPPAPAPKAAAPVPLPKSVAKAPPAPRPVAFAPKPAAALTPAPPAAPPVPFPLLPFVALNALFDGVCGLFGMPGRVLRSGFFKHVYGLAGVALLAYTAAHVAHEEGWIVLPVLLPWPPR